MSTATTITSTRAALFGLPYGGTHSMSETTPLRWPTRRTLTTVQVDPETGREYMGTEDVDGEVFTFGTPAEGESTAAARRAELEERMRALRPVLPAQEWMRLQDAIDNHETAVRQASAAQIVAAIVPMMALGGQTTGVVIRDAATPVGAAAPVAAAPVAVDSYNDDVLPPAYRWCVRRIAVSIAASFVAGVAVCSSTGLLGALAGALGQASASMGGLIH